LLLPDNPAVTGAFFFPQVNGINVTGAFVESQCSTASTVVCSTTGAFWLDIDAAEAANPGVSSAPR